VLRRTALFCDDGALPVRLPLNGGIVKRLEGNDNTIRLFQHEIQFRAFYCKRLIVRRPQRSVHVDSNGNIKRMESCFREDSCPSGPLLQQGSLSGFRRLLFAAVVA